MRRTIAIVLGLLSSIVGTGSVHAGLITPGDDYGHFVSAGDYPGDGYPGVGAENWWTPEFDGVDQSTPMPASVGGSTSTGVSNYGDPNADTVVLKQSWDFRIAEGAPYGSITRTGQRIQFTPEEDVSYTIAGFFTALSGDSVIQVVLTDVTAPGWVFYQTQGGDNTLVPGELAYIVGGVPPVGGHEFYSTGSASLTGTLTAGHVYEFATGTYIRSFGPDSPEPYNTLDKFEDGYSYGYGQTTLTLTSLDSVAVPEPTSMALLGLASLSGIGLRVRQRRRAKAAA